MKIEIERKELLDVVCALRARADVFKRMPPPAEGASDGPDHWNPMEGGLAGYFRSGTSTIETNPANARNPAVDRALRRPKGPYTKANASENEVAAQCLSQ